MRRNIGIFALLMLVLMMLFVSCEAQPELPDSSGDNGDVAPPAVEEDAEVNPLVGRWGFAEDRSAIFFEFTEYGTFTMSSYSESNPSINTTAGRYEINDDLVTLETKELEDFIKTFEFSIDGNELSISFVDADGIVEDEAISFFNIDEKKNDMHVDEDLVGKWIEQLDNSGLIFEFTSSGFVFVYRQFQSDDSNLISELMAANTYTLDETKPGVISIEGTESTYVFQEDGTIVITGGNETLSFKPHARDGESIELTDLVGSYVGQEGFELIIFEDGSMLDFDKTGEIYAEKLILDITNEYIRFIDQMYLDSDDKPFITVEFSMSIEDDSLTIADAKFTKVDDSTNFTLSGDFLRNNLIVYPKLELKEDGTYAIYDNGLMTELLEEGKYSIVGNKVFVGDKTFVLRVEVRDKAYTHLYWVEEDVLLQEPTSIIG